MNLAEYEALVAKVDAFFARVAGRYAADLACAAGCSGCCGQQLSVSVVEAESIARGLAALPEAERAALAERARRGVASLAGGDGPCVALDDAGRCGIYAFRPLVCRTQGLPMRVPGHAGLPVFVEEGGDGSGLGVCPLNFSGGGLTTVAEDCVLNVESLDAMLALVNARAVGPEGDRLARVLISDVLSDAHLP